MPMPDDSGFPLHHMFSVDRLGATPISLTIQADAAANKALAAYLSVNAVENVQAELTLRRWRKHGVSLEGHAGATIVQECVVTLEPLNTVIREEIKVRFLPAAHLQPAEDGGKEIIIDPMAEDPPEAFDGRTIDLGALIVEHLSLGIDPYPRVAGAALPGVADQAGPETGARPNPFQILERLRKNTEG